MLLLTGAFSGISAISGKTLLFLLLIGAETFLMLPQHSKHQPADSAKKRWLFYAVLLGAERMLEPTLRYRAWTADSRNAFAGAVIARSCAAAQETDFLRTDFADRHKISITLSCKNLIEREEPLVHLINLHKTTDTGCLIWYTGCIKGKQSKISEKKSNRLRILMQSKSKTE